jgi:2-iminoacetate synthase
MDTTCEQATWIDERVIEDTLKKTEGADAGRVREILDKSLKLKGLDMDEVAALATVSDPELLEEIFHTAKRAKEEIYGPRLVLFAPLYISNLCNNECLYCAFRRTNKELKRRVLSQSEIAEETRVIINQGHKRILLVAGESYPNEGFKYILDAIGTIYSVKENGSGEVRRVNVNVAPLPLDDFKRLKAVGIGTYQCFQETYHRETYAKVHVAGVKRNYDWRVTAFDRAMEAGIDDVGVGVLFGLYDWRFEMLALMQQIKHLEDKFGVGCHTISVPRMEPALNSDIASRPPHPVSDKDFKKIVAIFRLAVPYTGIIMSTRENADTRRETFELGVSQISAGSRTNPGGYNEEEHISSEQFQLGDHRSLAEVIEDVAQLGYVPSFCTGCYRLGRTGQDFMDMAKPGLIKQKCGPNAISTFMEYLLDYATPEAAAAGRKAIAQELERMDPKTRKVSETLMAKVTQGKRDVFC